MLSPILVGGIAALAGGDDGWRWAYFLLGIPAIPLAILAFRIPEPPRGQFEKLDVLGEVIDDTKQAPISIEAAFARLNQIRTFKTMLLAFAALGFGLFTGPVLQNLYLEDQFGLEAFGRGVVGTVTGIGVLCVLPFTAKRYDALFRRDPAKALRLLGAADHAGRASSCRSSTSCRTPCCSPRSASCPASCSITAFTMVSPVLQSIVPVPAARHGLGARLDLRLLHRRDRRRAARRVLHQRTRPAGRHAAAERADHDHRRAASSCAARRSIKNDLSLVVAELREELAEHERQKVDPEHVPAIQVHDIDFSYGPVQVLFDVSLRGAEGRGARPARHERRRQVDDPAGDRRARHAVARRRPPARHADHLRRARAAGEVRRSGCCPAARACSRR